MTTLQCTFEQFKRIAMEFHREVGTMNREELQNAWKCLGLAYLGMNEPMWQTSAAIVLKMECRAKLMREVELQEQEMRGDPTYQCPGLRAMAAA